MKEIKLTQGKYATVDSLDYGWLSRWVWRLSSHGYAMRRPIGEKIIYMHRLINETPKGMETDHINGNKLDNRRCNLRNANKTLNGRNRGENKNNTSGCKGVSFAKKQGAWSAYIFNNYKKIGLGFFKNINDAIKARKRGEEAYWND